MSNISRSRFANSAKNVMFSLASQLLTIVLNIIGRRVFVQVLDAEYLGVSTAFSSILSILALAELGVGSAIIYSLYKPIAVNDTEQIKSLMRLYRNTYWAIGTLIITAGLCLIPFLDFFVEEMPDIPHVTLIYIMLVLQTGITYFFSYKTSFLTATQQSYILQKYNMASTVIQLVLQIAVLLLWGNYFAYLALGIFCPFAKNACASMHIDRMYPFLKEKAQKLSKEATTPIKKNILALFVYKVCQKLSTTIDTLLISKMLGVTEVAIYSNYHLIINYSDMLFISVLGAITPSIGNLMTTDNVKKKQEFFSILQLLYYWVSTYLAVGLVVLFNPLIEIWLGADYLFSHSVVIALVISITLTNFQRPCSLLRDANGLFWYGKFRPLAMAIINLCISVFLVTRVGAIGVVIGTAASKLLTVVWYDAYIVYKHTLKTGLGKYFVKYALHWVLLGVLALLCNWLYVLIGIDGIGGLIIGFVLVTVIVNGAFLALFGRSTEFKYLLQMGKSVLKKLLKRK